MQHLTLSVKPFRTESDIHGTATVINLSQNVRAGVLNEQGADTGGIAEHFVERQTHEVRFEDR